MTKSKKHSPIQSAETGSIVGQVSSDKMEAFAAGLEDLMRKSKARSSSASTATDEELIVDYNIKPDLK